LTLFVAAILASFAQFLQVKIVAAPVKLPMIEETLLRVMWMWVAARMHFEVLQIQMKNIRTNVLPKWNEHFRRDVYIL